VFFPFFYKILKHLALVVHIFSYIIDIQQNKQQLIHKNVVSL